MKKLLTVLLFLPFFVYAKADAPLGLTWGENAETLELKYNARLAESSDRIAAYELLAPPMTLPDFTTYLALVDKDLGLIKVILYRDIKNDSYGTKGKEEYNKFKTVLTKKYGKAESYEWVGLKLYKNSDEFYQCLKYDGCGAYLSYFENAGISIQINGTGRGEGVLKITYESDLFTQYIDLKKKDDAKKIDAGL